MIEEIWKKTPYEGYEVSNLGRFRSYWTPGGRSDRPRVRKPCYNNGRLRVGVKIGESYTIVSLAHLVALSFLGESENRIVIFKNFDSRDCRAENLQWATTQEAGEHLRQKRYIEDRESSTMGRKIVSEHRLREKYDRALTIRQLRDDDKLSYKEIGRRVGLSESGVCRIYLGLNNAVLQKALKDKSNG